MFIVPFVSGPWQTNCYVVSANKPTHVGRQPAFVIDAGVDTRPHIDEILTQVRLENLYDYFTVTPVGSLPRSAPLNIDSYSDVSTRRRGGEVAVTFHPADEAKAPVTIAWRTDVLETTRRRLEAKALPPKPESSVGLPTRI